MGAGSIGGAGRRVAAATVLAMIAALVVAAVPVAESAAAGPPGGTIVFIKDHDVWVMPAADPSKARAVTTDGTAESGYWAPAGDAQGTIFAVTEGGAGDIVRMDQTGRRIGTPFRPPGSFDVIDRLDISPNGKLIAYTSVSLTRSPLNPDEDIFIYVFRSAFIGTDGGPAPGGESPISGRYATFYDDRTVVYDPPIPLNGGLDELRTFPVGAGGSPLGEDGPWWFDTCPLPYESYDAATGDCAIAVVPDIPERNRNRLAAKQIREDVAGRPAGLRFWDLSGPPPAEPNLRRDCSWMAPPATGDVGRPSWSPDGNAIAWDFLPMIGEPAPARIGIYLAVGFDASCTSAVAGAQLVVPGGSQPYWTAAAWGARPGGPGGGGAGVGYWMLEADGQVHPFGDAGAHGDAGQRARAVDTLDDGSGYWLLTETGAVVARGSARHFGDLAGTALEPGEVASTIAGLGDGSGYWIFTDRGRAFAYGAALHHGDMAGVALAGPVVASAVTPSGEGYWMVGSDGGIFSFGDARFHGSMGGIALAQPVNGIAPDPDGAGYWLVAADGGIFAFDAGFRGSVPGVLAPGQTLNQPVIGAIAFGNGYLMVASDGGIFNFSDAPFLGSLGSDPPDSPVVGVAGFA